MARSGGRGNAFDLWGWARLNCPTGLNVYLLSPAARLLVGLYHSSLFMRFWLRFCRLLFALLCIAAIAAQGRFAVVEKQVPGEHFLSFFTIQSNLMAAAPPLIGAARPAWSATPAGLLCRGAVVLYRMITGVIYALLLSSLPEVKELMLPWADRVLHEVIPLVVLADWVDRTAAASLHLPADVGLVDLSLHLHDRLAGGGALVHRYPILSRTLPNRVERWHWQATARAFPCRSAVLMGDRAGGAVAIPRLIRKEACKPSSQRFRMRGLRAFSRA